MFISVLNSSFQFIMITGSVYRRDPLDRRPRSESTRELNNLSLFLF